MKQQQIRLLLLTGEELLTKARFSTTSKDAIAFTEQGMKALSEARQIADKMRRNSVVLFIEYNAWTSKLSRDYATYTEFCLRNQFEIISELDFQGIVSALEAELALTAEHDVTS